MSIDFNTLRARTIGEARRQWQDLPTPNSAWGLKMKARIAHYYGVTIEEMDTNVRDVPVLPPTHVPDGAQSAAPPPAADTRRRANQVRPLREQTADRERPAVVRRQRETVSSAEDDSWDEFYAGLEVEAEMERDRREAEAEADWYAAQEDH